MGIYRVALAVTVFAAVAVQFAHGIGREGFDAINFFSFFTIVCNLFGAAVLLGAAFGLPPNGHARDLVRAAATVYLTIVGVVFSILLANLDSQTLGWVNTVVHYVMPVAIVIDWCLDPPATRLSVRDVPAILLLPAAYLAYTLARGHVVRWYPYPFLDVGAIGAAAVAGYISTIFVFSVFVTVIVIAAGNALEHRRRTSVTTTP